MKIVIRENSVFMDEECCICGEEFAPYTALACAYMDVEDATNQQIGTVCPRCIVEGPDGMKERALVAVTKIENSLRLARNFAEGLQRSVISAPSFAEFREAERRAPKTTHMSQLEPKCPI